MRCFDLAPGEQVLDGVFQERFFHFVADVPDAVLVIDPPVIAHRPFFVQDDDFRRPRDADRVGQSISGVLENGKLDAVPPRVARHFGQRILPIRVHAEKRDSARRQLGVQ